MKPRCHSSGFSLVELTMVLAIVALLAGGLLALLPAQLDAGDAAAVERQLSEARDALLGFAAANGYLPCPAKSSADGNEDRSAGTCTGGKRSGLLPWTSLGIPRSDPWGRLIRYSVTPAFANSNTPFTLATTGDIVLRTRSDNGTLADLGKAAEIVAVVWSTGKNGYRGWQPDSPNQNPDSSGPNDDEDTNSSESGTAFIHRPPSPPGSPMGEFDDQLAWLPRSILFNRMIAAGRLP